MSGHGHVVPNANGLRARCGGPGVCSVCSKELHAFKDAEIERLRAENAKLREAVTWRPIESAPKTPKNSTIAVELIGWCPDETSPIGGDRRTIWWEPRLHGGCWYSDRDMIEHPTKWVTLPEAPR